MRTCRTAPSPHPDSRTSNPVCARWMRRGRGPGHRKWSFACARWQHGGNDASDPVSREPRPAASRIRWNPGSNRDAQEGQPSRWPPLEQQTAVRQGRAVLPSDRLAAEGPRRAADLRRSRSPRTPGSVAVQRHWLNCPAFNALAAGAPDHGNCGPAGPGGSSSKGRHDSSLEQSVQDRFTVVSSTDRCKPHGPAR